MMKTLIIKGERIFLRRLTEEDASEDYVRWMNDAVTTQYLESRFCTYDIESIRSFIRQVTNDNNYQFGIFLNGAGRHIGNIKIGGINHCHKFADIGFLIGEKDFWGKGIATEAVKLATEFSFNTLKLHKIWGGVYSMNVGSLRVFEKNGYEREGVRKSQYLLDGVYCDDIMFGKINPLEK